MITQERFCNNLNLMHLAYISGNEEICLKIMRGFLAVFPRDENGFSEIEHYCYFTNFGLLERHEKTPEELYNELLENEISRTPRENI